MTRPTECKWCGASREKTVLATETWFSCGSSIVYGEWGQSALCRETVLEHRIRRALEKIKSSQRWSVEATPKTPPEYYPDPDGWIAEASDVDEVARILEGDEDGDVS